MQDPKKFYLNGKTYTGSYLKDLECFEAEVLLSDYASGGMERMFYVFSDEVHMNGTGMVTVYYAPRIMRRVTIPARVEHEGLYATKVNLYWYCPECGETRGDIYDTVSYDGSRRLHVHGWNNPCGHIDQYKDLLEEAKENDLN